ncbi:hypothetical protein D3C86_2048110 [compost metagenome]
MPPAAQPVGARHIGAAHHQRLGLLLHIGQRVVQCLDGVCIQACQKVLVQRLHLRKQVVMHRLPRCGER